MTHTPLKSWIDGDTIVQVFPLSEAPLPTTVPSLFFRREQLANHASNVIYSFILTSNQLDGMLAVFHCLPGQTHWCSPPSAPFGGLMPLSGCQLSQLTFLLTCVRQWIYHKGGSQLTIKTAPSCYDPAAHELCHHSYLATGFLPNHTYSNHYIPIGSKDFRLIIEPPERRRLSKGKKFGLHVTIKQGVCDPFTEELLRECYRVHEYTPSIPMERLACFMRPNPDDYLILTNWFQARPVATAIMVRVSDNVLYHFLSGYLPEFRTLSPSLMLFEAAYEFCRDNGMGILDLGISLDHHGQEKPSLARFKKHIGAKECVKIVYEMIGPDF
ncbi:GNAT family N-acetyltransferase [Dyadobacter sp. CY261]|uniref:GNAT family N-acetyltransferase n=1 Tax=Dyadobacter sp. CY261 TaxID=2907203 RepID=UPI001F439437|nr:GNAT family N-acetyltransferase [Dyadobacter sp. CY261]MCF0073414.1 GNAT family N-acetyltransferase [Dyadobacter sp. CY261]